MYPVFWHNRYSTKFKEHVDHITPQKTGADPGFGQRGPQLMRPKVADVAQQSGMSEVSYLWPGV